MITIYSPVQIGLALHDTISRVKKDLEKPTYPETKIAWISVTSNKLLNLLETEVKRYNKIHHFDPIKMADIISALQTALNKLLKAIGEKAKRD